MKYFFLLLLYLCQFNFLYFFLGRRLNSRILNELPLKPRSNLNLRSSKNDEGLGGNNNLTLNMENLGLSQNNEDLEKKISELKDEDENPLHKLTNDDNTNSSYDPRCETKYKLVDKLKKITFIYNIVENQKMLITIDSCLVEMYSVYYVTLRNRNDIASVISTIYGWHPLILIMLSTIFFLITFDKILFCIILIFGINKVVNDIILKNLFKMKRPPYSASKSYGMPSGHSFLSGAICTFLLLHFTKKDKNKWNYIICLLILITIVPIPWSRVQAGDHTVFQVIVGSILGIIFGALTYYVKEKLNLDEFKL